MKTEVTLNELVGLKMLSGVDEAYGKLPCTYNNNETYDGNTISFILDDITYTAAEDYNDGYSSAMEYLYINDAKISNTFEPVQVFGIMVTQNCYNSSNYIRFYDVKTVKIVLEVGTDNSDDYYPSFVCSFYPQNMHINNH